ncbi:class I SAM-dependent methyltransferase [Pleurocapsales cyanobacterium LEGE 10410]|nr:class I SAM-dependent methyltransferase [Pleurocapsales cyanobacterium LEGE 10410]
MNKKFTDLLYRQIPQDSSQQIDSEYYIDYLLNKRDKSTFKVLDLGCGEGKSEEKFRAYDCNIDWFGLDIAESPEVNAREKAEGNFYTFDGINIPFADNCFDIVYSNQVFEHVRYPEALLKEIYRVLKPDGYFIGSVSYLEPYHSYSFWNYTPYGFKEILSQAGLEVLEIRPSIDALTLIIRRALGAPKFFSRWWKKESPLNLVISAIGKIANKDPGSINSIKLMFCGQFCFLTRK